MKAGTRVTAKRDKRRVLAPRSEATRPRQPVLDGTWVAQALRRAGDFAAHYDLGPEFKALLLLVLNGVDHPNARAYLQSLIRGPSRHRVTLQRIEAGREAIIEWPGIGGVACVIVIPFGRKRADIVAEVARRMDEMLRHNGAVTLTRRRDFRLTARDLLAFTMRLMPLSTLEEYLVRFQLPPLTSSKTTDFKTARRNAIIRGRRLAEEARCWPGSRVVLMESAQFKYSNQTARAAHAWKAARSSIPEAEKQSRFQLPDVTIEDDCSLDDWSMNSGTNVQMRIGLSHLLPRKRTGKRPRKKFSEQ